MRISLVFNPTAGGGLEADPLVDLLAGAGHEVRYRSSKDDWSDLLQDPGDLLVAAGGDGTVRDVALAASEVGIPFAILPFGTANNIAKSLGLVGDVRHVVQGWDGIAAGHPFDLGRVDGGGSDGRFVEAFGGGLFADLLEEGARIEDSIAYLGRETDRALAVLGRLLASARSQRWTVRVDGRDLSGGYLAVDVMNIRFAGPNVPIAPQAEPGDGAFEVVLVAEEQREALAAYATDRLHTASGVLDPLRVVRGSMVELVAPAGVRLRLDDDPWPVDGAADAPVSVTVRCLADAARVLVSRP